MTSDGFWQGVRRGAPIVVSVAPFAVLFGALAVDNGFSTFDAVLMSASIFAGASQMVGLQLFGHEIPAWVVILSVFAVNFRHILYSASVAPHIRHFTFAQKVIGLFLLTDPQYAEAEKKGERGERVGYGWYMGMALSLYLPWVALTAVGAAFGQLIGDPKAIGLDVLLPIYFMALVLGFRSRDHWLPVVAVSSLASVVAMKTVGSPWHVSIGALAGVLLGAFLPLKPRAGGEAQR